MSNIIQIKRSTATGAIPTASQLQDGELAINLADLILYIKNANGDVVDIAGSNFARLIDPQFEGSPTAPTPVPGDRSNKIATTSYVRSQVDKAITGLDFQKDVVAKQVDSSLDPKTSPVVGDRYLVTDISDLHANFGNIDDIGNGDIVEYDGSEFQVVYDISDQGEGALLWDKASNSWQRYDGTSWEEFGGLSGVVGGAGITVTGDTVAIDADNVTIHTNVNDKIAVKSSTTPGQTLISQGSGDAKWGAVALGNANATSGILPVTRGGTGVDLSTLTAGSLLRVNADGTAIETATKDSDFLDNSSMIDGGSF
jgi:hypothetical protein